MKCLQSRIAIVVSALFLSSGLLEAQDHPNVARGFWADHAFDLGGINHVNEVSSNLILTIPIGQTYGTIDATSRPAANLKKCVT